MTPRSIQHALRARASAGASKVRASASSVVRTTLSVLQHSLSLSDRIVHWLIQSRLASRLLLPRNWLAITCLLILPYVAYLAPSSQPGWAPLTLKVGLTSLALWLAGQLLATLTSIYVARRWVFIPRPTKGAPLTSEPLVMVRRNATRKSWSPNRLKPPQVLRWDILGVGMSFMFGKITAIPLWRPLRAPIFSAWAKLFHAKVDEAEHALDHYASLQDFFTRALKPGLRPVADSILTSPVDGRR